MLKRVFDVSIAVAGLIIFLPALVVIGLLVKLDSPGPVFYRGLRVGKGGRPFRIWKLRTMVANAETQGPPLAADDDPRITRVGRWLRRTRIDEIPQFINVLKGQMSIVGPAAEDPAFVELYTPEQRQILSIRPGMTSPAALAFCDEDRILALGRGTSAYTEAILPVKLDLDLAYVREHSVLQDLAILARTLALGFPSQFVLFRRISKLVRRGVPWSVIDAAVVAGAFFLALLFHAVDTPAGATPTAAAMFVWIPPLIALYVGVNYLVGLQHRLWRYAAVPEVVPILRSASTSTAVAVMGDLIAGAWVSRPFPLSVLLLGGFFTFCGFVAVRYGWSLLGRLEGWRSRSQERMRAVIYGAGEAGQHLAWRLLAGKEGRAYKVVGFIDDNPAKRGLRVHGIKVLGGRSDLASIVDRERVELIILAIANISGEKLRAVISTAQETPAQIRIAPSAFDWMGQTNGAPLVREVRVGDLLGRQPATMDRAACHRALGNRIVVVTGACGSIGSELCRQIATFGPQRVLAVDNNESGIYDLELELRLKFPTIRLEGVVGDVTDESRMDVLFRSARPQVIFHVAAYKHVPLMEEFPEEAVRVNISGTRVALRKARQYGSERFVLVSTDKAVNPSSVMGATKRIAEMLVMTDGLHSGEEVGGLKCTVVRFGNVLGSRGSVVPTFARQIEAGGPVTVTHPEMTRYFMDVSEAVSLIIQATTLTHGGDIFMLDMGEHIRIDDLARKMIRMRGLRPDIDIPIVYTGMRPGEKLHEELTYDKEERIVTEHPLIHRVSDHAKRDRILLEEAVDHLLQLATTGRRQELVDALLKFGRDGQSLEEVQVASAQLDRVGQRR